MIGYARVSTGAQSLDTQLTALKAVGCEKIYREKISGVAHRRELERLLGRLQAGDVVVVTKLDRLARSTLDLLRVIDKIGKAGAGFKSLGDQWADTTSPHGRLLLTMLAGIAAFERDLILERTSAGRARAKAEGKHLGRFPKLTGLQQREVLTRLDNGEPMRAVARSLAVHHSTISRIAGRARSSV